MDDLISRTQAIDAVSRGCQEFRGIFAECEKNLNELPAVQTCDDAVSRQQAVDALDEWESSHSWDGWCYLHKAKAKEYHINAPSAVIMHLPALQPEPEIVRCKDCKHYKAYEYTGRLACHYVIGGTVIRNPNDFCSRAERITDEGSD